MLRKKRLLVWLLPLLLLGWLWWGNSSIQVSRLTVADAGLPAGLDGLVLAQVSDLHNAEFGAGNAGLLARLAAEQPDVILLTGDLVDSRRTDIDAALDFAAGAVQTAPVYYVTGNHEMRLAADGKLEELLTGLAAAGVTVLANQAAALEYGKDVLWLAGLDDSSVNAGAVVDDTGSVEPLLPAEELSRLLGQCGGYTVLLAHRPEFFDLYAAVGANVVFCGHAHGGQWRLPGLGAVYAPGQGFDPEYTEGVYQHGETQMVVSRGLGNSIFPLRVNNRPELVIVELVRVESQ